MDPDFPVDNNVNLVPGLNNSNNTNRRTENGTIASGYGQAVTNLVPPVVNNPTPPLATSSPFIVSSNSSQSIVVSSTSSHSSSNTNLNKERLPLALKVALVGDSTVGKTSIASVFCNLGTFPKDYHMTCGVHIHGKSVRMPGELDNGMEERVNVILLDSSGKDLYKEILPRYWEKLDAVALVFDLTSNISLEAAGSWLALAKAALPAEPSPPLAILLGNKGDLTGNRTVSASDAKTFASQHNLQYFECSAKNNEGIEAAFDHLITEWTARLSFRSGDSTSGLRDSIAGARHARNATSKSARKSALQRKISNSQGSFDLQ